MELSEDGAQEDPGVGGRRCVVYAENAATRSEPRAKAGIVASRNSQKMTAALHSFLVNGKAPAGVPQHILRSWHRSAQHGLDPEAKVTVESASGQDVREALERNEALVQAAWGEIEVLCREIESPGGLIVLTDADGVVLSRCGTASFVGEAGELALRPGVQWSEASIGTNAIGIALVECSEAAVYGGQHFLASNGILSCSAVPIIDPAGALIGVLDLSTASMASHQYALPLLRRAAAQIERRLFEQMFGCQTQMRLHTNPFLLGGPHEGMMAFDGDRLVGANRHAMELLGLTWSAVGAAHFHQLFSVQRGGLRGNASPDDCIVQTTGGVTLFARLQSPGRGVSGSADATAYAKAGPDRRTPDPAPRIEPHRSDLLPHEVVERLLDGSTGEKQPVRKLKAGSLLCGADVIGTAEEAVLIVRRGRLRNFSSHDGKELTLFFLTAGDCIVLHSQTMLEVKADSEVIVLNLSTFRRLAQDEPALGLSMMPVMERHLQKSIRMLEDLAFHGVKHRLVRLLCDMAEQDGRQTARGVLIDSPPHAEDLAMQVGSTRQTVSTIMADLVRGGVLQRVGKNAILVPSLERLSQEFEPP